MLIFYYIFSFGGGFLKVFFTSSVLGECFFSTLYASVTSKGPSPQPRPLLPSFKAKQSQTLVTVVRTDFNQ